VADSNGDGIIKIGSKSKRKFQVPGLAVFECDVIDVQNQWREIDAGFRDSEGGLPVENIRPLQQAALMLFLAVTGYDEGSVENAQALEFLKHISEIGDELHHFFVPKLSEKPSSPQATELRFST